VQPLVSLLSALKCAQESGDPLAVVHAVFTTSVLLLCVWRQSDLAVQLLQRLADQCRQIVQQMRHSASPSSSVSSSDTSWSMRLLSAFAERAELLVVQYRLHVASHSHLPFIPGQSVSLPLSTHQSANQIISFGFFNRHSSFFTHSFC
jgi:hypothetical protein